MIYYKLLVAFSVIASVLCFEPFTSIGVGVGLGAIYYYGKCWILECCDEKYIKNDVSQLWLALNDKIYGQHIAKEVVLNALAAHLGSENRQKALTLSFHGTQGSGKNYIAKFITDALYTKQAGSKFVHYFNARIHFPLAAKVPAYQDTLVNILRGNTTECAQNLFIFDEVDKMPQDLLNVITPFIDYHDGIDKVDYRKNIFIFLSNTGSKLINKQMLDLWAGGKKRNEVTLADFENLITQGAFNEEGGFYRSDTIKSNLIDHYIPFLPMELEHVRLCITDAFKTFGLNNPREELIQEALDFIEWGPQPEKLYSKTGCKRISQKVGSIVYKQKQYKQYNIQ